MTKGLRFGLLAACISGVSVFVNTMLAGSQPDPVTFVALRNFAVVVFLTVILAPRLKYALRKASEMGKLPLLFFVAATGGGLPFVLFFAAIPVTGAVTANFINKTLFIWVGMFSFVFLGERLGVKKWYLYLLIASAMGITIPLTGGFSRGIAAVLAATVLWSLEYVISKKALLSVDPDILAWARITFGLPVLLAFAALTGHGVVTADFLRVADPKVLVSAGFLIAYMAAWYRALRYATASSVSLILSLAPVVTILLDAFGRNRVITTSQALSGLLITSALLLLTIRWRTEPYERTA